MGAGGDGRPARASLIKKNLGFGELGSFANVKEDLATLRHIWFSKAKGEDNAARLESFYGPQAEACG